MSPTRPSDPSWRDSCAVMGTALLLRLWHLFEYSSWPTFRVPLMDARYHTEWAERVATGGGDAASFFRAPAYAYVLAGLRALGCDLVWAPRWCQLVLGVVCVLLVHRLALRMTTRGFALFAGILAAILWVPIHHETELLLETLFTAQLLLLTYLVNREDTCPGALASLGAGLLLGLAAITRPNALVWTPLLLWPIAR
ncbi:MAG: glycosyltransferase family 39 protein, partial [Candidatus Eisenbacteria bacterium]